MRLKITTLLLLFGMIIPFASLQAQDAALIGFKGKVFLEEEKGKDVIVNLYDKNQKVSSYTTRNNGKFILDLERNKHYTVEFVRENYITKRIVIDTKMDMESDYPVKNFAFDVQLIQREEGIDYSELDFPMAIIEFEPMRSVFDYDMDYSRERKVIEDKLIRKQNQNQSLAMN